ncbi:MAG: recombinase family protein [Acidimicrobiia bacterium]
MRVVGYTREVPGPEPGDTVFAQSERIRRWVRHNSYQLVAMCQDPRVPEAATSREGYRALLGILASDQADMVVLPSLSALSADKVDQEIMLADLRARCGSVAVVDDAEQASLSEPSPDPGRQFVRDVLSKAETYRELLEASEDEGPPDEAADVLVHLIPARRNPPPGKQAS